MKKFKAGLVRNSLLGIALLAFGLILYLNRSDLRDTWELIKNVQLSTLILLPLVQMVSYFFISNYYRKFLEAFKAKIAAWRAFGTTYALNFVNQILPSGGGSGTTYLVYAFKDVARPGTLTMIQVGRYVFAFLAYVPVLLTAMAVLLISGEINRELGLLLIALLIITLPGMTLLIIGLRKQNLLNKIIHGIVSFINFMARVIIRRKSDLIGRSGTTAFMQEFHEAVELIHTQGKKAIVPYLSMLGSTIAEITIVVLAFAAIGVAVNPAVIVLAFTAANVVGAISIIPGDVGVHELTIITVLSYVGIPSGSAIAATLLYRVFSKMITMSIGFLFYIKLLKPLIENARHSTTS